MKSYFGIVHKDADSAYGIHFPDIPLCWSAADEFEDLLPMAMEALALHAEGGPMPEPRPIEAIREAAAEDLAEGGFLLAVPLVSLDGRTVRANITLDAGLLGAIDAAAQERKLSRSAFLAQAARHEIEGRF